MWRYFNKRNILCFIVVLLFAFLAQIGGILFYPSNLQIIKGEKKDLDISFPFTLDFSEDESIVKPIYNEGQSNLKQTVTFNGLMEGNTNIDLKLLGIPLKSYNVNVVNRKELIPGGNAVGIKMNTLGALVVAVTDIIDTNGNKTSPSRDSGIRVGDSIIEIDGKKIESSQEVVEILNDLKDIEVELVILRDKKEIKVSVNPVQSIQDNAYRIGVWVRDRTSGIGTMTYYDEDTNTFGALGHGISDMDTKELLKVEDGTIMNAKISDVEQGEKGVPGEIKGIFYSTDKIIGRIEKNIDFGVYGSLTEGFNTNIKDSIPIGFRDEVETGKAHILTTLDGEKIGKYEIEIEKVERQDVPKQKSMVVKITDEELLNKTGGIVQGMSGSPIIQNGKLIGAITHVFVNDPTKGYGLFIEWMLNN